MSMCILSIDGGLNLTCLESLRLHEHDLARDVDAHLAVERVIGPRRCSVCAKPGDETVQQAPMPLCGTAAKARDLGQQLGMGCRIGIDARRS